MTVKGPLQAGSCALSIQETATGSAAYCIDFSASVMPEASTGLMFSGLQHGTAAGRTVSQRSQGFVDLGQRARRHRQ